MADYVIPGVLFFSVIIVAGSIGGFMAADRGRTILGWCALSALFPPFLLVLYFLKPLCEIEGMFRKCPECGELIKWQALYCKHCKTEQNSGKRSLAM